MQELNGSQEGLEALLSTATSSNTPEGMPDMDAIWSQYSQRIQHEQKLNAESLEIFPQMGLVAKTKLAASKGELEKGMKVFINITSEPSIGPMVQEEEQFRVPCSLGPMQLQEDKAGNPCLVFDVVYNTDVVKSAVAERENKESSQLRNMLAEYAMQNLMHKHELQLEQVVKFPALRYKGTGQPPSQRIRKPKAQTLIEEVAPAKQETARKQKAATFSKSKSKAKQVRSKTSPSNVTSSSPHIAATTMQSNPPRVMEAKASTVLPQEEAESLTPVYKLWCKTMSKQKMLFSEFQAVNAIGVSPASLLLIVTLPGVFSISDVDLEVGATDVVLMAQKQNLKLYVDLPCVVSDTRVSAKFDKSAHKLRLTLPVIGSREQKNESTKKNDGPQKRVPLTNIVMYTLA